MHSIKLNTLIAKKDTDTFPSLCSKKDVFRASVIYLKMVKDKQSMDKNRF